MKRILLNLALLCTLVSFGQETQSANRSALAAGDSVFYEQFVGDTRGYIEYIQGNLPIIISAPHGGVRLSGQTIGQVFYPDNDGTLPDRGCGTNERDDNTEILVREIQAEIFNLTGCYAHVIINNLHRSKLDPNREIGEAACGDQDAEDHWFAFHNFIDQASTSVESNWGKGLYIDLHGQSHSIARVELGYNITSGQLNSSNLNSSAIVNDSSIKNLVSNNLGSLSHEDLVRGSSSLGALLKDSDGTFYNNNVNPGCGVTSGYRAIPSNFDSGASNSCDDTRPFSNSYFNGDFYNNLRHGSGDETVNDGNGGTTGGGGNIDGIMSEVNRRVRDLGTYQGNIFDTRPQTLVPFAQDYAAVLLDYIDTHYNDFTQFNFDAASYDVLDSDPTPTIGGVSGGTFSSASGLIIDSNTGVIDVSASTVGNYIVTYTAGTCTYYSSTQNVEITDDTLSITNSDQNSYKIFPNPVASNVTIQSNVTLSVIDIYNTLGQKVKSFTLNAQRGVLDLSSLNAGVYIIELFNTNTIKVSVKQLVKE